MAVSQFTLNDTHTVILVLLKIRKDKKMHKYIIEEQHDTDLVDTNTRAKVRKLNVATAIQQHVIWLHIPATSHNTENVT